MRIALIHAPFGHRKFSENLRAVNEEFIHGPPIILAYVAAILERAGQQVILVDAHNLRLSKEETLQKIKSFNPSILGFRMDTYNFFATLDWLRWLKQKTGLITIAGGINFDLYPEEAMTHSEIDYAVIGEAIESLPKLIEILEHKSTGAQEHKGLKDIPGIAWRENGKLKINPPAKDLVNFNSYPFPARHLLPNEEYYSFVSEKKNYTIMLTSIGCPYNCIFCPIAKIPYRERSVKNVVDEIKECYYKYKVREIDFFDPNLFLNKQRIIEICREIKRRGIKIIWSARSRVDSINEELLKEIFSAGCRRICFGIESASPQILEAIQKKTNSQQNKNAVRLCKKYGIHALGFFMFGNPGETVETMRRTIRLAMEFPWTYAQFFRVFPKPGTDLAKQVERKFNKDLWSEFILGRFPEQPFPTPWTDFSREEVTRWVKRAYFRFYFRPFYILKRLIEIRSFDQLIRYIRAGLKMLFQPQNHTKDS